MGLFFGEVQLHEAYSGARRLRVINMPRKRGRGTWKQPVFGVFERDVRVYTELIPNAKSETLKKVIRGRVSLESILFTDGWRGYSGLLDVGFEKQSGTIRAKMFQIKMVFTLTGLKYGVFVNSKKTKLHEQSFWSSTKRKFWRSLTL